MRRAVRAAAAGEAGREWRSAAGPPAARPVAVPRNRFRDPGRGLVLFEGGLGMGVDAVRQLQDLGACPLDGRGDALLGIALTAATACDAGPSA